MLAFKSFKDLDNSYLMFVGFICSYQFCLVEPRDCPISGLEESSFFFIKLLLGLKSSVLRMLLSCSIVSFVILDLVIILSGETGSTFLSSWLSMLFSSQSFSIASFYLIDSLLCISSLEIIFFCSNIFRNWGLKTRFIFFRLSL